MLKAARVSDLLRLLGHRSIHQPATSLRAGQSIFLKGKLFTIVKANHVKGTARQSGNVQLELRDVKTQLKHIERLRSSADVDVAFLHSDKWTILYTENTNVICMHPETYEQMTVDKAIFGQEGVYLSEGMEVTLESHEDVAVIGKLPSLAQMKVLSVEDTVHDGLRDVVLSNGSTTKLPAFVQTGDIVSIYTKDGTFAKRVKS